MSDPVAPNFSSAASPLMVTLAIFLTIAVVSLRAQPAVTPEDVARRQYASGLEFLQAGRHAEALKDFQTVVDSYPATTVADDALLAIARYQLERSRDAAAAQATAESVLKKFPASDSVAMAYVVAGQALVEQGLTQANVDAALASFERVPRLFPGTEAVAPALYAAGETLRRLGRCDEALGRFDQVALQYPRASWTARARLAGAICHTMSGRVPDAMSSLYRVTAEFGGSEPAEAARTLSTTLYRLYVRAPAERAYVASERAITGPGGRLRDVSGLAVAEDGSVYVAGRGGVTVFDAKGAPLRSAVTGEVRGLDLDRLGRVVAVQRALAVQESSAGPPTLVTLTVPRAEGPARVLDDLTAVAVLSSGERLVADRETRAVYRFSDAGKFVAPFASIRAARMAVGPSDRVALLDRDSKTVVVLDRKGATLARIPARGTGYELVEPADVAFDSLGHLYVLDRSAVLVFPPGAQTPAVTFTDQPRATGGLRDGTALAVDAAARLYIYDDSSESVLIYE
jgi:outer membrane protein assembly factor BamD (BamD/ComL family)